MSQYESDLLQGVRGISDLGDAWDDLWQKSGARQPTVRLAALQNWLEHFADNRPLSTVVVRNNDRLVAALPLLHDQARGLGVVYKLPVNCWANAGDLLVDPHEDVEQVLDCLVTGIAERLAGVLSLEEITLDAWHWQEFQQAVRRRHGRYYIAKSAPVGVVDLLGDWEAYEKSWSGNHRSAVKRSYKKLQKQGEVRIERCSESGPRLEELMRLAFEIEDRSWKGDEGTSVLKTPGMLEYMLSEAQRVAESGHLDLWFLYLDDEPIAFEYCHVAKGTCFSHKIGYDPQHAKLGPGRLLRYLQLQQYDQEPDVKLLDTLGTFCQSKAKWATRTYEVGKMYTALGGSWASFLVDGYAWSRPFLESLKGDKPEPFPTAGAASYLESAQQDDLVEL